MARTRSLEDRPEQHPSGIDGGLVMTIIKNPILPSFVTVTYNYYVINHNNDKKGISKNNVVGTTTGENENL